MRELHPMVLAAKEYLEKHNLEMRLSEAMQAVLREKPEDPAAFVAERLAKSAGMVQKLPKVEEAASSQPSSPAAPTAAPAATAPAASATPAVIATPGAPQANVAPAAAEVKEEKLLSEI